MTQAPSIKVVVHGASGRMGREVVVTLCREPNLEPVGAVDQGAAEDFLSLPDGSGLVPFSSDLSDVLKRTQPDVVVDFTNAQGALAAAQACAQQRVHLVTGSTGLEQQALQEMEAAANQGGIGILVAPNFALGAVLLLHLARIVSRHFDHAEVSEAHHEAKVDAPSGTALALGQAITEGQEGRFQRPMPSREPLAGTRGGDYQGVSIHSTRMPGRMAHHEVTFGAPGQTLSLRHDTISRECYMPGVLLGIRYVLQHPGLTVGLERVLNL